MNVPTRFPYLAALFLALLLGGCKKDAEPATQPSTPTTPSTTAPSQVVEWLTTPDKTTLFYRPKVSLVFGANTNSDPTIVVDTTQTFQTMDGFGFTLTGGSAYVLSLMSASSRAALIRELFATDSTYVGVSYLRISIGASDLSSQVYTYDDAGTPDPGLANFSLAPEQAYFIPVLREILAVNPAVKILGSPWTAPSWMKSNNSPVGGSLLPQYYDAYARYFVKYVQGMQAAGIPIDAVTLQNEPLNPNNNPSMVMTAAEQAAFIKNNVGPAFRAANLATKIIAYDHNPDQAGLNFVTSVLSDAAASPFIDGSAFHLYGGVIGSLDGIHNQFPTKNVYFTEQWVQAPGTTSFGSDLSYHVNNLEIGAPRNWSRNVLEWNLASDQNYGPHTNGGCSQCLGAVTIAGNTVTRNVAYYTVAHSSKFVRPGSVRVATNTPTNLPNVAYKTPSGKRVLVVLNSGATLQNFNIQYKGKVVNTSLYGGSVATYVW
ncbi:glycoside hydrolase family 30 protein [Hymenobacter rubidus]|uniref:glycoside hydrolase family 30 protein n=1 Tax=Hymenobacter rubidus TaxID=1441626 RepID=UPI00191FAB8B|nr:glycoside hydrolase family 30 beta sandwich domain-containing protein [Hymenobacter rubidus]